MRINTTKRMFGAVLLGAVMAVMLQAGHHEAHKMPSKVISASDEFMMEVESIDTKTGEMVLRGSKKRLTLHVNKDLHNLKKIHRGDWLIVTVYEEAVVTTAKGGEPASAVAQEIVAGPKTAKPTLKATEVTKLTAKVVDIDHDKRTVTLEGPHGGKRTIR
ncbi:hypothetical protein, partial [Hydrogenimonas sp.]